MTLALEAADEAGDPNPLEHITFTLVYGDSCVC